MFDLSISKLLVLALIALIVFGPNELPKVASQAGRILRDLRRIAEGAKADLREGLGPEFQDFDFEDLNPRRFVQKHLLEEGNGAQALFDDLKSTSATISSGINDALNGGQDKATVSAGPAAETGQAAASGAAVATAADGTLGDGEEPPFDLEAT